jgi:three-Cys-motif partner protein
MATSAKRTIPWVIEDQTRVKHALLSAYVGPWMNILWQHQERSGIEPHLIFVDGFAGPGEYWDSHAREAKVDGSPIIVGKIANELIKGQRKLEIIAFDDDEITVRHLEPLLNGINRTGQAWEVCHVDFVSGTKALMDKLALKLGREYPTFFFIDPFGYSGFPMRLLADILKHPRTEAFITFMTYDIVRFMNKPEEQTKMFDLFATDAYKRHTAECQTPEQRVNFITTLYRQQLLTVANAKYALGFRVNTPMQGERARYFLFHASNNTKALKEMKNAMARVSEREFSFEAIGVGPEEQLDLFVERPEEQIKTMILGYLKMSPRSQIEYSRLEDWAYERTAGVARHIKAALVELESEGKIEIERKPRQRQNTVTEGALLKFVPALL